MFLVFLFFDIISNKVKNIRILAERIVFGVMLTADIKLILILIPDLFD